MTRQHAPPPAAIKAAFFRPSTRENVNEAKG